MRAFFLMLCKKPYMQGTQAYGCGQCLPCRINRGRQWTWRQYLESLCHDDGSSFVTLTYSRAHIRGDWSLDPIHLRNFLKRIRYFIAPRKLRFFAVGEYGEDNLRPHYHVSLFGMSPYTRHNGVLFADLVSKAWPYGFSSCYEFNEATAQYTCGYITKKLRDRNDNREWNYPEFARMSLKPGLGSGAMQVLANDLLRNADSWKTGDVPRSIRIGKRTIGLGRYMLNELREAVGFTDQYIDGIKQDAVMEKSLELLSVFQNSEGSLTFKEAHAKQIAQKLLQVEARYKIWQSKRSL